MMITLVIRFSLLPSLTKGELEGVLTSDEALPLPNPPLAKGRE